MTVQIGPVWMVSDETACEAKRLDTGSWAVPAFGLVMDEVHAVEVLRVAEDAEALRRRAARVGLLPDHLGGLLLGSGR